jgi:flagellar hook protein FlgE
MGVFDAMAISVTGLNAQSSALNTISTNVANASTPGFKSTDTHFADMLAETQSPPSGTGGVAPQARPGIGVQGAIATSGVSTNLAISGNGYFLVKRSSGPGGSPDLAGDTLYTRRGDFAPDAGGHLVNGAGDYLVGSSGTGGSLTGSVLVLPNAASGATLSVSSTGGIVATASDGSAQTVGQITLAHFASPDSLDSLDGGTFAVGAQSGTPTYGLGQTALTSGALEQSDTTLSDQFSKMIVTQQAYSANTKVLSAANEMMQTVIAMNV